MLANFHTHTTFCDGSSTPEEIVLRAIENGFDAIGFSGHGYTAFGSDYCIQDTDAYISSIQALKDKYKGKIQIYLGVEEDAFAPVNRADFDYIIGSSHFFCVGGKYYAIDSSYEHFQKCLALFNNDAIKLAETYYEAFCDYILARKPDIIGHFDLITKYDEMDIKRFLDNRAYVQIAKKYLLKSAESDMIFEVNTGAIARGVRCTPYPQEELLYTLKKCDGKIMLASDSHSADTLDFHFAETKQLLRQIGFQYVYVLYDNTFIKTFL